MHLRSVGNAAVLTRNYMARGTGIQPAGTVSKTTSDRRAPNNSSVYWRSIHPALVPVARDQRSDSESCSAQDDHSVGAGADVSSPTCILQPSTQFIASSDVFEGTNRPSLSEVSENFPQTRQRNLSAGLQYFRKDHSISLREPNDASSNSPPA